MDTPCPVPLILQLPTGQTHCRAPGFCCPPASRSLSSKPSPSPRIPWPQVHAQSISFLYPRSPWSIAATLTPSPLSPLSPHWLTLSRGSSQHPVCGQLCLLGSVASPNALTPQRPLHHPVSHHPNSPADSLSPESLPQPSTVHAHPVVKLGPGGVVSSLDVPQPPQVGGSPRLPDRGAAHAGLLLQPGQQSGGAPGLRTEGRGCLCLSSHHPGPAALHAGSSPASAPPQALQPG